MFCLCVIKNDAKKLVESVFIMAQVMSSKSKTDKIAALLINDAYREVIQACAGFVTGTMFVNGAVFQMKLSCSTTDTTDTT